MEISGTRDPQPEQRSLCERKLAAGIQPRRRWCGSRRAATASAGPGPASGLGGDSSRSRASGRRRASAASDPAVSGSPPRTRARRPRRGLRPPLVPPDGSSRRHRSAVGLMPPGDLLTFVAEQADDMAPQPCRRVEGRVERGPARRKGRLAVYGGTRAVVGGFVHPHAAHARTRAAVGSAPLPVLGSALASRSPAGAERSQPRHSTSRQICVGDVDAGAGLAWGGLEFVGSEAAGVGVCSAVVAARSTSGEVVVSGCGTDFAG